MIGEFKENGKVFSVYTPKTPRRWNNRLFNDRYVLDTDQMLQGGSSTFVDFAVNEWIRKERNFYVLDRSTKEIICPLYNPLKTKLDKFESRFELHSQSVLSEYKGLKFKIRAFVPAEGYKEVWTVTVKNETEETKNLSLFTAFSFEDLSFMGSHCKYDESGNYIYKTAFPGHALYDEKEKLDKKLKYVYLSCDKKINSFETNKYRFYGCDDSTEIPISVINGVCTNTVTEGMESILAAAEHRIELKSGEETEINFVCGVTVQKKDIEKEKNIDVKAEFEKVVKLWDKRCDYFKINTEHKELNYLVNYWFKKQVTYLSRTNRLDVSSPVRNEMQDTMGYAFCEPYEALEIMKKVLKRQHENGYIKQWNIHDGSGDRGLSLLRHSDAPIWLIICFTEVISTIIKDNSLYDEKIGFLNSENEASIMEHLIRAAQFMTDENELGSHGICLMRDGEWTDPMNGVGRFQKGESVWNTMALIYAIKQLNKVKAVPKLMEKAEKLSENLNKYFWDGEWYLAAIDDSGRKVGTHEDEEGKIFLNTQTWAVISGVAEGERLNKVKKSLDTLKTDFGYKLSDPPFTKWNEKWGKISIKQMGALENGAVYCHGSLFKAYGDYVLGNNDEAVKTILATLPTNPKNPDEINMQLPLYVPNYYFGYEDENFGRSSCFYNTGTTAWILDILYRMFNK